MPIDFDIDRLDAPPPWDIVARRQQINLLICAKILLPPLLLGVMAGFGVYLLLLLPLSVYSCLTEVEELSLLSELQDPRCAQLVASAREVAGRLRAHSQGFAAFQIEQYCWSIEIWDRNLLAGELDALTKAIKHAEADLLLLDLAGQGVNPEPELVVAAIETPEDSLEMPVFGL